MCVFVECNSISPTLLVKGILVIIRAVILILISIIIIIIIISIIINAICISAGSQGRVNWQLTFCMFLIVSRVCEKEMVI